MNVGAHFMKKINFQSAHFLGSMLNIDESIRDRYGNLLPEIALAGRSNVGKSSLINHLLRHKGLARISSQPGKTTLLNFFKVDDDLVLVDLPGYGYAARSAEEQMSWSQSIDAYFKYRKMLKLILLLVDSRRGFSENDFEIVRWAAYHQKLLLIILTKSDTLKPHEKNCASKKIVEHFPEIPSLHYSIKDGKSRTSLIGKINHLLSEK
jgi:GTP-binding protein